MSKENSDYFFTGPVKVTASATNMTVAAMAFGVIGAAIASAPTLESHLQKLDFRNGSFILIEKR